MEKILLRNHGGIIVEVTDNLKNAITIIKYNDHGDEFLVVKTDTGIYEYGWYLNRIGYPDYYSLERVPDYYVGENKTFITAPKLYYKLDFNCIAANKVFSYTDDLLMWNTTRYEFHKRYHAYDAFKNPQQVFDSYIDDIKEIYDGKNKWTSETYGHTYHMDKTYLDKIENFLKNNGIYIDDNISKLESIKKYFRIDEVDGSAGKKKVGEYIIGDYVEFIIYNGKNVDLENSKIERFTEEESDFGEFDRFELNVNDF